MLLKLIAWLWIILGILFFIRPQLLQKRLHKKSFKKIRKALFIITLFLSFTLISVSFKVSGLIPKLIALIGIIGVFKAFFLLKSKVADKLIDWSVKQPLILFRAGGIAYILIGFIILKLSK